MLIGVLANPEKDDIQKAVACYDLGEFARYYSKGKKYLEVKGGKEAIMSVMQK
jgi:V-type H+-transporting ATPase subunit H